MQLINLFTFGLVAAAASVSAAPSKGFSNKTPACLLSGQVFNGAGKVCRCPPGQAKKPNRGKCGFPSFSYPSCGSGERAYCARSRKEYCGYDDSNDLCDNDGRGSSFCSREQDLPSYLSSHYDY